MNLVHDTHDTIKQKMDSILISLLKNLEDKLKIPIFALKNII